MESPVELEVFRHAVDSIVEEMGITLQRTAYSTNIKIRRDHTCALFNADLDHVAQHDIAPQHIGSIVMVVPEVIDGLERSLEPGDGVLVNDPSMGTVHLPDVMLISPLFEGDELVGYAANSAHHVDIGGSTPGGIPTDSTELYQEGLILPGVKAVSDWRYDEDMLALITRNVRVPRMRRGDYRAQLAANKIGQERYLDLIDDYSLEAVTGYFDELLDYTERRVRSAITELPNGRYQAADHMDGDGVSDEPVRLELALEVEGDTLTIDFTGTADQNEGPLNSTPSAVFAATMSVLMGLLGAELPKNQGFYRPIELIAPEGTMVNPSKNAPVAGCWEVAMRSGELVTRAMADAIPERTIAATKGIVCNVAFGGVDPRDDDTYVFLETVAGGYGARAEKDGMDAVQTHFQNTANSPIEELEREVPVHIRRYELIQDSEGAGRQRGGVGVRRDYAFYDHRASFSILSDRTKSAPWGLFGGHAARPAHFERLGRDGSSEPLNSKTTVKLDPGEVVSIQTPGGGGYEDPLDRPIGEVAVDLADEIISEERAHGEYGVVLDERGDPDETATERHRRNRRRSTASETGGSR